MIDLPRPIPAYVWAGLLLLVIALSFAGGWAYGSRPAPYVEDAPPVVTEAGRPLQPRDTAPSANANVRPESVVVFEPQPEPVVRTCVSVPESLVSAAPDPPEDAAAPVTDSTATPAAPTPLFTLLPNAAGSVDLTAERLRLTVYDTVLGRYEQRTYAVPPTRRSPWGAGLSLDASYVALWRLDENETLVRADIVTAGLSGTVRYRNVTAFVRPFVEPIGQRVGVQTGLRLRLLGTGG